jgi:hypothetical protein
MNLQKIIFDFFIFFCIAFVVSIIVGFLYSLVVRGSGTVDWGFSFQIAFVFSILLSWMNTRETKNQERK